MTLSFQKYIIGPNRLQIPSNAISVQIKLSSGSRELLFQPQSFNNVPVNYLGVEGVGPGKKQIEISQYTFDGNRGNLLKINLTNCDVIALRTRSFSPVINNENENDVKNIREYLLYIDKTHEVNIFPEAFDQTFFHGSLRNINELNIQTKAFSGTPDSVIRINNSKIGRLSKMTNKLKSFEIRDSTIETVETNAFDAFEISSVIFDNCTIGTIQSNVFTNKVSYYFLFLYF